jgi:hypothetical protein
MKPVYLGVVIWTGKNEDEGICPLVNKQFANLKMVIVK